ncbi:hypothetical protein PVMG_06120 [Plasmodium vivax Mauritania I]|uniref:VIR protein n=1 Tax=Plasmodium vivax Mauritania I TaxID=1035515 RepID=A0A0J9T2M3_PLAVI|nr:hypothetical protein PVMG_06120 [Plasmodium vivax Mauritania I]
METPGKTGSFESSNYDLFERLSRHLAGDGIFLSLPTKICCSYINYWLNDQIDKKKKYESEDDFMKFKKFAKSYDKDRNMLYRKESCEGYLKRIYNEDNYNRKKSLYEMYDWYNWIQIYDVKVKKEEMCYKYSLINYHYRNLKESYTSDDELISKLDDFINVINKSAKSVKEVCGYDILPPLSQRENTKQAQEPGSRDTQMPDSSGESVLQLPKEFPGPVTETRPDGHSELLAKPKVEEPYAEDSHTEGTDKLESTLEQSEVVESSDASLREGLGNVSSVARLLPKLPELRYEYEDRLRESIERPDGGMGKSSYGLRNTQSGYPNTGEQLSTSVGDTKGILTNVQDTFFSIVKDVDPAPVLVVSGGMGVLFILFKYTPFGSFFGGRRRRMHQIPSSFRAFPPGEFPIFHEYEGGNIGYCPMNINPLAE